MVYGAKLTPIKNPDSRPKAVKQIMITTASLMLHTLGVNFAIVSAKSNALSTMSTPFFRENNNNIFNNN